MGTINSYFVKKDDGLYLVTNEVKKKKRMNFFRFGIFLALILAVVAVIIIVCGAVKKNEQKKENEILKTVTEATGLGEQYFYDEALAVISGSKHSSDAKLVNLKNEIENKKASLVEYDGQFYHVFFHSLIVYPELAFDGDYMHEGYDMWMTTVSEFKAMLPQLYERGFILCSIKDISPEGKILLPEGKKPLVISIDDVNYYEYMENDGFADRLLVDESGNVVCEVKKPDGSYELSYEGDVMPILDGFVKEHPDFSYRGAKGIVAVTGYEGAFGYDFAEIEEGEEKERLKAEAKKVAEALKNTGWLIACHSYSHNDYFRDGGVTFEELEYDTVRFLDRISESVLNPDIYISPFGYHLPEGDERLQHLKSVGFDYFCPVSTAMRTFMTKDGVLIQERFNLDRFNMRNQKEYINNTFFDVDTVYYKN